MEIIKGMGLLVLTLIIFSGFSLKAPKGQKAMAGLANAAVATFLVEAIHKYINGDFLGFQLLGEVGSISGSMSGVAAAILVLLNMGINPVFAVAAGAVLSGHGILPGFIAGYLVGLVAPQIEKRLPDGINIIFGTLLLAPLAKIIALLANPIVDTTLASIGSMIAISAEQSPYLMGFLLGGIIKVMCTSPLSSMALTAMLGLRGLAMGIAAIACVGGSFTNGIVFSRLKFGEKGNVVAVMLEPLTQADIITQNPLPIYTANFVGGGLAGLSAAFFKIINNAPGTASPIPGLLAPLAFNSPIKVLLAVVFGAIGGAIGGFVVSSLFKIRYAKVKERAKAKGAIQLATE